MPEPAAHQLVIEECLETIAHELQTISQYMAELIKYISITR